jgi:homoserine O-acetyltransferase
MRSRLLSAALLVLLVSVASCQESAHWPTQDGVFTLTNFQFGSGETLPQLRLHYLTLGKLHRDQNGHTDNVILLLHGTGGDAHSLLSLCRRVVWTWAATRHQQILHHPAG